MRNLFDLSGQVVLITGASSGIGAAAALVMADLGARVALGYHSNPQGAERTRDQILAVGGEAVAIQADVRQPAEIRALVARAADALGPIDTLVNNAGGLVARMPLDALTPEAWDDVQALNLRSAVLASQAGAPSMIARRRGAIVNVGSIAGHHGGGPGAGAYAAAKAGLMTYTKSLARELCPHQIRVNGIAPGVIDTPFHEVFSTPEMMRAFVAMIPLGRVGTATECATVIAFLASEAAAYIVGETIEINGGQLML